MGVALDRKTADMVFRIDSRTYEVRGLPDGQQSPAFGTRIAAEKWLSDNLVAFGLAKDKRGPRACMTCRKEFESAGIHNRMCNHCRGKAPDNDPVRPYIGKHA